MKKIFIKLTNKPYTIFVEENITSKIINFHKKNFNNCKAYIITDNNVKNLYFTVNLGVLLTLKSNKFKESGVIIK